VIRAEAWLEAAHERLRSTTMPSDWTAPPPPGRTEPLPLTDERRALEEWVDYHRATLLTKCAGLTAQQLKTQAVPPSTLTLLGLVRHMTDVERWWFRMHAAQEQVRLVYFRTDQPDAGFYDLDQADAAADIAAFEEECATARLAVDGIALDTVVPSRGHHPERTRNVRWIFLHMIEEYARHNGHADLLRQAIDGATGA
jgi:uncharacterized damage-inducible protein DinB